MNFEQIENDDVIDFQLITRGILDDNFKGVTFLGKVSYAAALANNKSINAIHDAFFPYMQNNTPGVNLKPESYQYILVKQTNGTIQSIGIPWILMSTLTLESNQLLQIKINNPSKLMEAPIRDLLTNLGADFELEYIPRK